MQVIGPPTQADYLAFLRTTVGVPVEALPDNSQAITISYNVALDIVSDQLNQISGNVYTLALYNLAADRLINFAQDQATETYFQDLRKSFHTLTFAGGVVQATSDEGTSSTLATPDAIKALTLADLQNLKTPYGRAYLEFTQMLGTCWGLT